MDYSFIRYHDFHDSLMILSQFNRRSCIESTKKAKKKKIYRGEACFYHKPCCFLFEMIDHMQVVEICALVCHLGVLFSIAYVFHHAPNIRSTLDQLSYMNCVHTKNIQILSLITKVPQYAMLHSYPSMFASVRRREGGREQDYNLTT